MDERDVIESSLSSKFRLAASGAIERGPASRSDGDAAPPFDQRNLTA
jgi:hypothetical protein